MQSSSGPELFLVLLRNPFGLMRYQDSQEKFFSVEMSSSETRFEFLVGGNQVPCWWGGLHIHSHSCKCPCCKEHLHVLYAKYIYTQLHMDAQCTWMPNTKYTCVRYVPKRGILMDWIHLHVCIHSYYTRICCRPKSI